MHVLGLGGRKDEGEFAPDEDVSTREGITDGEIVTRSLVRHGTLFSFDFNTPPCVRTHTRYNVVTVWLMENDTLDVGKVIQLLFGISYI